MKINRNKPDVFPKVNALLMILICFITLYPIWYTIVLSFNDANDAQMGGIYWWPRVFSLKSYSAVFANASIVNAFTISVLRTVIGTLTHVFFTAMTAYAFSKKRLIGRNIFLAIGTFTMFFNGGLIPFFLLLKNLGMLNNFIVYIVPTMFNFFHLIIFTSFFRGIPGSLEESAMIDGANEFRTFVQIILPLSMPVLATIALFHGVWNWNDFFWGVIFVNDEALQPIGTYLYRIIAETASSNMKINMPGAISLKAVNSQSIKLATMVVATTPIVLTYPFLQKYFVKGVMIGSVKE
ncbi:MAG: carbohydrate ABC transporter permease [Spirochaetales bacterium]|nr:carbohydrate ABC transporter permease [Spirochaetales bacterium]